MDSIFLRVKILRCRIAGGFESLKRGRLYFLRKQKVAKAFGFCFAESRVDSTILHFAYEILRNCGIEGKHRICGGFCALTFLG